MSKNYKNCLLAIFTYNNGINLKKTLDKKKTYFPVDILINFDGSTDGSFQYVKPNWHKNLKVLINKKNRGIAFSIKKVIKYAITHKYEYLCLMPGNNKNNINQSIKFFNKLCLGKAEYVQGSRFLKGGSYKNTPLIRILLIKVFSFLLTLYFKKKCTDCTEGMRAYKLSLFKNKNINISQKWLKNYELESYIHFKVLQKNIKYIEISVKKIYPKNKFNFLFNRTGQKYTYIRPIIDWLNILKPYFYLGLGIKK